MARYLALEWDAGVIRLACGEIRGRRVCVVAACAVPVETPGGAKDIWSSPLPWQEALAPVLDRYDLRHLTTVVAVRRGLVQLQELRLPRAPEDELPEMVRFQAEKEFGAIADGDAFDFAPLGGPVDAATAGTARSIGKSGSGDSQMADAATTQAALAAMLPRDRFEVIVQACRAVKLRPRSITLGSCATASLLAAAPHDPPVRTELAVELLEATAEMTLLVDGRAIFVRTARMLGHAEAQPGVAEEEHLVRELKRTVTAAENRFECGGVERLTLLLHGQKRGALIEHLRQEFEFAVRAFDPWSTVSPTHEVIQAVSADCGHYGPALGMLLDVASHRAPAIDWLNPRRAEEKAGRHRPVVLAGIAAGLLVLGLLATTWWNVHRLDLQIARAAAQLAEIEQMAARLDEVQRRVAPLDRWLSSDVVWLDELYRLSDRFPPAEDAVLTQLQIVPRGEGATMLLEGRVRGHSVVDALESSLRDDRHDVVPLMSHHDASRAPYSLQFKSTVGVTAGEERVGAVE